MLKPKKSLGQNFLIDKNICKKIISLSNITNKNIIEIGPGLGFMTDFILEKNPKNLILIEKDEELKKLLLIKYKKNKKVTLLGGDILNFDLSNYKDLIIFSNLPYNLSTKIILYLFKFNKNINEMIFMIQKEVAIKFDYNLINMNKYKFITKIVSEYSKCFDVSPKVFFPKPKIMSTVVKFKLNNKNYDLKKVKNFSDLIFKNVRKKIINNLNIKINNKNLLNKRVNQLSIKELLNIYNFF